MHASISTGRNGLQGGHARPQRVLFTCTTFLSLPGKMAQCLRALVSIKMVHSEEEFAQVSRFLLINEHSPNDSVDYKSLIEKSFPWINFVQKTTDQRGQAASLNIILEHIKSFSAWIHWEESWLCRSPFIAQALDILATTDTTQLQISEDIWSSMGPARLSPGKGRQKQHYVGVLPHPHLAALLPSLTFQTLHGLRREYGVDVIWPLYSLRPSVNRAPFYGQLAPFDCSPAMWPHLFEWEYGLRWLKAGGQKAILLPEAAVRQAHHCSTHAMARR